MLALATKAGANDESGDIIVSISGLGDAGDVKIALVKDKETFESDDKTPFMGAVIKAENNNATYVFKNVPFGEYAIKFFQDKDGDGKLTCGAFGIPKEPYGLSNNIRSKNFDKAKFSLNESKMTISIKAR